MANIAQNAIDAISQWGPGYEFDPLRWGGRAPSRDANGNPIAGSSGAEQDVDRYRALGASGYSAPTIDQTQIGQTGSMAAGSLGLLGTVAAGGRTRADALGTQLAQQGQNQLYGMAQSTRGGPMARAAAFRAAQQGAGANMQRAQGQIDASHAANMQAARGAYADAATGLQNQNVGLASGMADLQAQQNALNEQRQQGYERLGYNVQSAEVGAQLGRSAAEQAAANTARQQASAENAASAQQFNQIAAAGAGAASGLASGIASGYAGGQGSTAPAPMPASMRSDPYDPYATSDERAKNVGGYVSEPMANAARSMEPHVYAYKPGHAEEAGQAPGERNVGPMAQSMAADPVASTAVVRRPDGMLAIDKDKGLKLALGSLSSLQHQIDDLRRKR